MKHIIIPNPKKFETIKKKILENGTENFHIIADFDGTLTKEYINGKKRPSIISELRNSNYLDEDYQKRAYALYDKYHPYEIDNSLSKKEKKEKMEEWWRAHFKLLIEKGLSLEDIKKVSNSGKIELRSGLEKFLEFLKEKNILLIILSASGIGESIPLYLKEKNLMYDNIHIVSNFYKWNEKGIAIGIKEPIIHSANKDEHTLEKLPFYSELQKRKNVLLLGNTINDLDMIKGFEYNNLLNIGFFNEKDEKNLEIFKTNYDAIITEDSNMDFINLFLKEFNNY